MYLCILALAIFLSIAYFIYINQPIRFINKSPTIISPQYKDVITWITEHTEWQQKGTNAGWAGFDKVYFIALPKRLSNVKRIAKRLGITDSAWILKAIYKDSLNVNELLALNIIEKKYLKFLTPKLYGAIGCQLSHLAVMLDCYKDPLAKTCVIFEDDLYLPATTVTSQITDFRKRVEKLKINWDVLYLDYCFELGGGRTINDVRWLSGSACMHAYVIKKETIPVILAAITPMKTTIDGSLSLLMQHKSILAIGPNKARYFAQNRTLHGSTISPGFEAYPAFNLRDL